MQSWLRLHYDLVTGKYFGEVGWVLEMAQSVSMSDCLKARGYSGGPQTFSVDPEDMHRVVWMGGVRRM